MKLFPRRIAFIAIGIASFCAHVRAQTFDYYTGNANGTFENPADWTMGVPNASQIAAIAPGGTFSDEDSSGDVTVNSGPSTITLTESTPQAAAGLDFFSVVGFASGDFDGEGFGTNTIQLGTVNFNITNGATLTVGATASDAEGIVVADETTVNFAGGTINVVNGDVDLGANFESDSAQGTLNITSGTLDVDNGTIYVGTGSGEDGVFTESGASTVSAENVVLGFGGSTGTLNLKGGALTANAVTVGSGNGSTGAFNQSGGTFNALSLVVGSGATGSYTLTGGSANVGGITIGGMGTESQTGGAMTVTGPAVVGGTGGTGTYNLTGGTAVFDADLIVGSQAGDRGAVNQSGGSLTVNTGPAVIGESGTGTYNISGGTAAFTAGLTVGAMSGSAGTVSQSGNSRVTVSGNPLALTQASSLYNLNGGTLEVGSITGPGRLNFGGTGGTLQIMGNTFTDSTNSTISRTATIDAPTPNTAVMFNSGILSGPGALILEGSNSSTFVFNNVEQYQGGTSIENGTLSTTLADLPHNGPLFINTNGTLLLTGNSGGFVSLGSSITGSGNLNIGANDIELTQSNFSGTINLGTGNLRVSNGSFGAVTGGGNLFIGGDPGVARGGTVNLAGPNSYTGNTTVTPGFTLLTSGLLTSPVTNEGSFGSDRPLGSNVRVDSLNQPLHGTGNLLIRTNGMAADSFTVTGTANLFGTVGVSGVGAMTYTIVTAGTLNSGANNGTLVAVTNSPLFTATLAQPNANTLRLTTYQGLVAPFAQTPNQLAVANSLDQIIRTPSPAAVPLIASLDTLSAGELPGALDELTPQPYLYMRDIAFENSTFLAQRMNGFLGHLRDGFTGLDTSGLSMVNPGMESGLGRSLGSLLAYNNEGAAPNGVDYYPDDGEATPSPLMEPASASPSGARVISDSPNPGMTPTAAPPPPTSIFNGSGSGFNEFISGDVVLADLNQNNGNNEPKAHYTAGDATAGVSFRMNSNLAAGVLFDYDHTDARTGSQGSHVRVDTYSPGFFATYFKNGFYANGLFSYGFNEYSNSRNIGFAGTTAKSSPGGDQYVADLDFGYDFHPDRHWTIGPTLGVEYTHLDVDSFAENGAGPGDLRVDSQNADSIRARIGGHVIYQVHTGSVLFQPNLTLQYQHEFLDNPFDLDSQLSVPGTPVFVTQGTNPGRDSALLGVGLTATLDNSLSFFLNYLAEVGGDDYFLQSVQGGLKASF